MRKRSAVVAGPFLWRCWCGARAFVSCRYAALRPDAALQPCAGAPPEAARLPWRHFSRGPGCGISAVFRVLIATGDKPRVRGFCSRGVAQLLPSVWRGHGRGLACASMGRARVRPAALRVAAARVCAPRVEYVRAARSHVARAGVAPPRRQRPRWTAVPPRARWGGDAPPGQCVVRVRGRVALMGALPCTCAEGAARSEGPCRSDGPPAGSTVRRPACVVA